MRRSNFNRRSATLSTPTEALFRSYHTGLIERWNRPKFFQLCKLTSLTKEELGAYVGLSRSELKRYYESARFPLPVVLHFQLIENYINASHGVEPERPLCPLPS